MNRSSKSFDTAVSQIRSALRRRVNRTKIVSSVDVNSVAPGIKGSSRGAAVRAAFSQLVSEGFITPTSDSVYNRETHHSVVVYKAV